MSKVLFILLAFTAFDKLSQAATVGGSNDARSFGVDHERQSFLLDGKPFRFASGSFHYFRVPHFYWEDRIAKMAAAGLDALQTYVAWNVHEPEEGQINFDGQNDLVKFLKLAQKHNLFVLLRPGPYICAEWEYGGLPAWLLSKNESMIVRKMDLRYIQAVDRWFSKLLPLIRPYLYTNGGPILMVQVENEYGSYFACDHDYVDLLAATLREHLGSDAFLYTTDGNWLGALQCGTTKSAFATVDFGVTRNVSESFDAMRKWNKGGPLMNSELYTGWLDFWGDRHHRQSTKNILNTLEQMDALNASYNMYMFEGGTSFGFMNGADPPNLFQISSYDYDSPLSEAGDVTEKYHAIRDFLSKSKPNLPPVPKNSEKASYGDFLVHRLGSIVDLLDVASAGRAVATHVPLPMEQIGHYYGFILYRHIFDEDHPSSLLKVQGLRDRGYLLLDGQPMGILDANLATSIILSAKAGQTLDIVVENLGRFNYGSAINDNKKGIISEVSFGKVNLTRWTMHPIDLTNFFPEEILKSSSNSLKFRSMKAADITSQNLPSIYMGSFKLPRGEDAKDTFLDMCGWSWGVVYVNGHNLGRFRPKIGPQTTLYVPSGYLRPYPTTNVILVFELEGVQRAGPASGRLVSVDKPQLDSTCFKYSR